MSKEIGSKVKKIVADHLGVEEEKVVDEASFIDDLGADSLDTVELVMAFEEEFGTLPAAKTAVGTCMPAHLSLSPLNTTALGRPTTVVRNGCHIANCGYLEPSILQGPNG